MNVNAIVDRHLARALREIRREKVFYDYVLINDRVKAIIRAAITGALKQAGKR